MFLWSVRSGISQMLSVIHRQSSEPPPLNPAVPANDVQLTLSFSQKRHHLEKLLLIRHFFFLMDRLLFSIKILHSVVPSQDPHESPQELTACLLYSVAFLEKFDVVPVV
jgi:hypothetical protein